VRTLKGHGHWVNTLALSTEYVLRTGAHDHTGKAPKDPQEALQVRLVCLLLHSCAFGRCEVVLCTYAQEHSGQPTHRQQEGMHWWLGCWGDG
jgi:hypothetical protein